MWIIGGLVLVLLLGFAAWGPIVSSRVEQPRYLVIEAVPDAGIEIRDYEAMVVAETAVTGDREPAIGTGFRRIAGYIFGGNQAQQKIAMTAPVIQQADTDAADPGDWRVRFVMPAQYAADALPPPSDPTVAIAKLPPKRYAAIRFSGWISTDNLARHLATLRSFLASRGIAPLSPPLYAFYNPPSTLPFLRRNEVMIEIAR
jgi:effector-binding domain-containing protein